MKLHNTHVFSPVKGPVVRLISILALLWLPGLLWMSAVMLSRQPDSALWSSLTVCASTLTIMALIGFLMNVQEDPARPDETTCQHCRVHFGKKSPGSFSGSLGYYARTDLPARPAYRSTYDRRLSPAAPPPLRTPTVPPTPLPRPDDIRLSSTASRLSESPPAYSKF